MKRKMRLIMILLVIFALFGVWTVFSLVKAANSTRKAIGAVQLQDLDATKSYLTDAKKSFEAADRSLLIFTPLRYIPLFGWYIADAQRGVNAAVAGLNAGITVTEAITPYADVLGFNGQGTFLGGTAQERLSSGIEALSKITPELDKVGDDLKIASSQIEQIQSWRYPNILPGDPGKKVDAAQKAIVQIDSLIGDSRPLIEVLPEIMGVSGERKYLVLLQNDKELRPTGGFITAYAIFRVNRGVIEPESSSDIYHLDATLLKKIPAPEPIVKYLPNVPDFNIRDSNISPDFYVSMKQFDNLYEFSSEKKEINGIIALNTQFVLDMIKVLGPIEANGQKYTTDEVEECACPQIIYELEKYADEPVAFEKGDRKGIIGVLMEEMMKKTFDAPKTTWPSILEVFLTSLQQKELLLYFKDTNSQQAVERINFAGRIYEYDGDYLHINEANFGGAKSNMYLEQKVKQEIDEGKDDNLTKKVTIEYKYPRRMDNCSLERKSGLCLAGIYRSWIRVYVPKGSTLIKSQGTEVVLTVTEDLDKTVFEGFFTLRPEGTAKIELEYNVPIKPDGDYKLLMQKQPGTHGFIYEINAFGKKQRGFQLDTDKELILKH